MKQKKIGRIFAFLILLLVWAGNSWGQTSTMAPNDVAAASICAGTLKVPVQSFTIAQTMSDVNLTGVSFTTTGTYAATDVTKFQLWTNTSNNLSTATQVGSDITTLLGTGNHSFGTISQLLTAGATRWFWITIDVTASPTAAHTLIVSALTTSDFTVDAGNKSGSNNAGGTQTFRAIFSAGAINTTGQAFCYTVTMDPGPITNSSAASGGDGTFTYQWQSSTDAGFTSPTTISANSVFYNPPSGPAVTTYYRRQAHDGTCNTGWTTSTGVWTVTVRPEFTAGAINTSGESVCFNGDPGVIGSATAASGGDQVISYQWQSSTDAGFSSPTTISSSTPTYDPPAGLTVTTYYRRQAHDGTCNTGWTTSAGVWQVIIRPEYTAGAINTTGETLCSHGDPGIIGSATDASGGDGTITYQWQSSMDAGFSSSTTISSNTATYDPPAGLTVTTYYRRQAHDGTCNTGWTTSAGVWQVIIRPEYTAGAINTTGETLCSHGDPGIIGSATDASGGDGTITYQWQSSMDAGFSSSTTINSNTATYDPPAGLTVTTYYRRQAHDGTCNTTWTNSSGIWTVTVRPVFSAGAINTTGETLCSNGDPGVIGSATGAIGGDGIITYQWQSSTDAGFTSPTTISINTANYDPPAGLTVTTYYRRQAHDGTCNTTWTNSAGVWTVTVRPVFSTGAINTTGQAFCYTVNPIDPGPITNSSAASGGDGTITYQWQSSTDAGFTSPTTISANSVFYNPPSGPAVTTYYRRQAHDGTCNTGWSTSTGVWTVTVRPEFTAGAINTTGETVCFNGDPGVIGSAIAATGGDGSITYQWQSSTDAGFTTPTTISSSTPTYDPPAGLTVTTYYRRQAHDGTCNTGWTTSTGVWQVSIRPEFTAGAINTTGETLCSNGDPGIIGSATDASGGDGTIIYQWQSSTDAGFTSPTTISSNTATYDPPAGLTVTTYYRRQTHDGTCATGWTNSSGIWQVTVIAGLSAVNVTPSGSQSFCAGASGNLLTVSEIDGGTITARQWGKRSVSGGAITDIGGQTGNTYLPTGAGLGTGTWYVVCTSTPTCGSPAVSNEVTVNVNANLSAVSVTPATPQSFCIGFSGSQLTASETGGGAITGRQWRKSATSGSGYTNIPGATTGMYTPTSADMGGAGTWYVICTSTPTCGPAISSNEVVVTVNPSPTLTGASQVTTVCAGSSATINLTGLLAGSTSTVAYSINGTPQTPVTAVTANGSGDASFTTVALTSANNGQTLQITGITVTSTTPNCSSSFTRNVTLSVDPTSVGGNVASAQSICSGTSPADLTLTGNTGSVVKWQKSSDAGFSSSTDIAVTSTTLTGATIGNLTANTYFRAVVQSGTCSIANSASVLISVNPLPTLTGASQAATVCAGSSATINLTGLLAGSTSTVAYSINGTPQTPVTAVTANSSGDAGFTTVPLTSANDGQTLQITGVTVTSATPDCSNSFTRNVTLSVDPTSVGGNVASAQTICSGTSPADLTLTGNTGSVVKWQKSSDAGFISSTDIAVTSTTLTSANIGNLTANTYFRAVVQSGTCGSANSASVLITVNSLPTLTGASQAATVCAGSSATINLTGLLAGSTSTVAYSINGTPQTPATAVVANGSGDASFTTAPLTSANNGQNLQITGITVTSATPNCNKPFTQNVNLSVDPGSIGGTVASAQTICEGTSPADLTLTGNTGSVVKWQKSSDAGFSSPTDIAVTSTTLTGATIGNLTANTYFRAVVQSGTCSSANSASVLITVNPLPAAAGTISGLSTVCQGQTLVNYTVPVIANATGYNWTLPALASITAGANSNSITVSFSTSTNSGIISVNGTNSCGNGTASDLAVTVNPLPGAAGTISGTSTVCVGQNGVSFSVPAIAHATSYLWSYSGTGATINGTTNPVTIDFSVSATAGNLTVRGVNPCGNGTVSQDFPITVTPPVGIPAFTLGAASTRCQGAQTITYTANAANATGITYSLDPASITGGNTINAATGAVTYLAGWTYTSTITATATGCNGPTMASHEVTIAPNASITVINGKTPLCINETNTYTVTADLGGGTGVWSSSNDLIATVDPLTGVVKGIAEGPCNIIYTINGGCGSPIFREKAITVYPNASITDVTGKSPLCVGEKAVYTASAVLGGTGAGSWTTSDPAVATVNSITGEVTAEGTGTCNIIYEITEGCGGTVSETQSVTVSVSYTANAGPDLTACQGQAVSLSGSSVGGATDGTWTSSVTGGTFTPSAKWNDNPTWTSPASFTGQAILTLEPDGSCSTANDRIITVNPPLPVSVTITVSPNGAICAGTSVTFTANPVNEGASPIYQWYNGTNLIPGETNSTYTSTSLANGDAISVKMTSNGTCISGNPTFSNTITMAVNPLPVAAGFITGPLTVCQGQTDVTYSVPAITNATGYMWALPTGASITEGDNTNSIKVSFSTSAISGDITVYGTNGCGNGIVSQNYSVTVNPSLPVSVGNTALPNGPICAGTSVTFSASPVNGGSTPSYQWYNGANPIPGATGSTFTSATLANGDVISVQLTSNETCASGSPAISNTIPMTVNQSVPVSVSITALPNGPICNGELLTFTANPVNEGASPIYQWYNGVNPISGATGSTYTSTTLANGDAISVQLTSGEPCASGSPATSNTLTMAVNPSLPVSVSIAASSNPVCAGTPVTFTATPVNGGSNPLYLWKVNGGSVGNSTSYTYTPSDGDVVTFELTSDATCGTGSPATSTLPMMVYTPPTVFAGADRSIPNGNPTTISDADASGYGTLVYSWTPVASFLDPSSLTPTTVNLSATNNYTLTVTDGHGCKNSDQMTITITGSALAANPTATPSIICAGSPVQLNANASGGSGPYSYSWTSNTSSFTSLDANPVDYPSGTTTYTVVVYDGSTTVTPTVTVTVNPNPSAPATGSDQAICANDQKPALTVTVGMGETADWYATPSGGVALATGTLSFTPSSAGTYYAEARNTITGCKSTTRTGVTLTINPNPSAPVSGGNQTACANQTTPSLTVTVGNNETADWYAVSTGGIALATNTLSYTPGSAGTYYAEARNTSTGCKSTTRTQVTLTVNANPSAPISGEDQTACANQSFPALTVTVGTGQTADWYDTVGNKLASGTLFYTPAAAGTYYAEARNTTTGCTSTTRTGVTLVVNQNPAAPVTGENQEICANQTIPALTVTVGSGEIADWYAAAAGGTPLATGTLSYTPGAAGTYYAEARNNSTGCKSTTRTGVSLTIHTNPSAPTSGGNPEICVGQPVPALTVTVGAGETADWYAIPTGGGALATNTLSYTPSAAGTYYAEAKNLTTGCTSTSRTAITITEVLNPAAPVSGNDKEVCINQPFPALTVTVGPGETADWYTAGGTLLVSGTLNYTPLAAGTYFAETRIIASGCKSAARTGVTLTVNPLPTASISGPADACQGSTVPVTFTGYGGTMPYTFSYRVNGGSNSQAKTDIDQNSITVAIPANLAGTLTVELTNVMDESPTSCLNSVNKNHIITVHSIPVAPDANSVTVCYDGNTHTASATPKGPGETIKWYTAASGGTPTSAPSGSGIGTYQAWAASENGNNCESATRTLVTLTITTLPTAVISGTDVICQGQPVTLTFTLTGTAPWRIVYSDGTNNIPVDNIPASPHQITVSPGNSTLYTLTAVSDANCTGTSFIGFAQITVVPLPTANISGNTTVCRYGAQPSVTFTNPQASGITVNYTRTGGGNNSVSIGPNSTYSVSVPTNTAGDLVYTLTSVQYQGNPNCPNPVSGSATVTVLETPTASISGGTTVCQDDAQPPVTFTNPQPLPITITYNINGANQATINVLASSTNTVQAPTNVAGPFVYNLVSVAYQGSAACSTPIVGRSVTITVRPKPIASITSGNVTVCRGGPAQFIDIKNNQSLQITVTYTIFDGINTNQFNVPISGNGTTSLSRTTGTPGTYVYTLVSARYTDALGCTNTITGQTATVEILPTPVATIGINATVCQGTTPGPNVTFTNPQTRPITVTYNINGLNPSTININGSSSATVEAPTATAGSYSYNLVSAIYQSGPSCLNNTLSGSAVVTVRPAPTATISVSGNATVCKNEPLNPNVVFTNPQGFPVNVSYNINGGTTLTQNVPSNGTYSISVPTTVTGVFNYNLLSVQYQTTPNCLNLVSGTVTVTVLEPPQATIGGTTFVCQDDPQPLVTFTNLEDFPITVTYNINGFNPVNLNIDANSTSTVSAPTNVANVFNYNLVSVAYQGSTTCSNSFTGLYATITVRTKPTVTSPGNKQYCAGVVTSPISLTGTPSGVMIDITGGAAAGLADQTVTSVIPAFTATAGATPVIAIITLTPRTSDCTGTPVTFTLTVNPLPTVACPTVAPVCLNSSVTLTGTPLGGTYTGPGISGNIFYALTAGVGTHTITYTVTDPTSACSNSCNFTIAVNPTPVIPNQPTTLACNGIPFTVSPQNGNPVGTIVPVGTTYSWSAPTGAGFTGGSAQSNQTSISQTLTLTNSSVGATATYSVTPLVSGCPGQPFTVTVSINANPPKTNIAYYYGDMNSNTWTNCAGAGDQWENDLDVWVWQNGGWLRPPRPGTFESPIYDDYGWQTSYGTNQGPWVKSDSNLGTFYQHIMSSQIFKEPGVHYYRFYLTKNGCTTYSDTIVFAMTSSYEINAGGSNEVACSSTPAPIQLTGASVSGVPTPATARWSIYNLDPANASNGSLSDLNYRTDPNNVTYTPPANYSGTVTLMLTSPDPDGGGTCREVTDTRTIIITPNLVASAGNPQTVCAGGSVVLNGSINGSYEGFTWSATSGIFTNENTLTPTYTPGITSGSVTITLTPTPAGSCVEPSTTVITVNPAPIGTGVTICQGAPSQAMTSPTNCPSVPIKAGPKDAGLGNTGGTGTVWTGPGNIISDNGQYARASNIPRNGGSQNLNATNFGFNIPDNATIMGITVEINRYGSSTNNGGIRDVAVQLLGGNPGGQNKAISTHWSTNTGTVVTYGGVNDTWGNTWTPAQIKATGFGVTLDVENATTAFFNSNRTASVDYIRVTVTYSVVAALNWYTVSGGGTPVGTGSSFNPVNVPAVLAAGYPYSNLANTNTPGTYTFYLECSTFGGCRTPVNYVISPKPTVTKPPVTTASACSFTDQAAVNAAFNTWLTGFTVTGGVNPTGSYGTPTAPQLPGGGTTTVTYNYSNNCESGSVSSTYTVTAEPTLVINKPENVNKTVCDFTNQGALNTDFTNWFASFTVSGGCGSSITLNPTTPSTPQLCTGGTVTVTYTVTNRGQTTNPDTRTYTVPPPAALTIEKPMDVSVPTCTYADQAAVDAAFITWLAGFKVTGGCASSWTIGNPTAPSICTGGTTGVTLSYSDVCRNGTTTASFTLTKSPDIVINKPSNEVHTTCDYPDQAAVDAAFASWLTGFGESGGCNPAGSYGTPTAPVLCTGGTTVVTYQATDLCNSSTTSATFTINAPDILSVGGPDDFTASACNYTTQAELESEFANWLNTFVAWGGCSPTVSFDLATPTAPVLCEGGTVTLVYSATDVCGTSNTLTRSFTITKPAALVVTPPANFNAPACNYPDQTALNTAFQDWINSFTVSGGCTPQLEFTGDNVPDLCSGGSGTVNLTVTSLCETKFVSADYIVAPPDPIIITSCAPPKTIVEACRDQSYVNAQFANWVSLFGYTGGCNATATDLSALSPPSVSGGIVTVNFAVSDACGQGVNCDAALFVVPDCGLHYRTLASVNWTIPHDWTEVGIWETNTVENGPAGSWISALVYPTESIAKTIKIRNGHQVYVNDYDNILVDETTIEAGGIVAVNSEGTLSNIGTPDDFVIESESPFSGNGYGSLIVNGTFNGPVTYNLWTANTGNCPGTSDRAYILSSPVLGQLAGPLRSTGYLSGIYPYNEGINDWGVDISPSQSLESGHGYAILREGGEGVISFKGDPNVGPISVDVASTKEKYGWNSVGNPYTSALKIRNDLTSFLRTNLPTLHEGYGAIYLWDEDKCKYAVINLIEYPIDLSIWNEEWNYPIWYDFEYETDNLVQVGQGFLVNIKWPPTGNKIKFNSGMQTHSTTTTLKKATTSWPGITLLAKNGTEIERTIVTFFNEGTTGLDPGYDAGQLSVSSFGIYTRLVSGDNDLDLAIQTLPDNQYEQLVVPVGIECPDGGEVSFKAGGVILPDGLFPVLEDRLLKTTTPLKTIEDSYTVTVPANTSGTGRFYLRFSNVTPSVVTLKPEIKFSAWFDDGKIIIFGNVPQEGRSVLYDVSGRKLGEYHLLKENRNEIPAGDLVNGVYLLLIQSEGVRQVIKVPVVYE